MTEKSLPQPWELNPIYVRLQGILKLLESDTLKIVAKILRSADVPTLDEAKVECRALLAYLRDWDDDSAQCGDRIWEAAKRGDGQTEAIIPGGADNPDGIIVAHEAKKI